MTTRGFRTLLVVLTLLLTFQSASSANYSALSVRALVTVTMPNISLQAGNSANNTIYVNGTSAMVTTPTLNYPTGSTIVTGTFVSGTTPGSVNAIDTNYFTTSSTTAPDAAFKDGASLAVTATIGLIDSITTTFPSGDNLVIAIVQFDNTGGADRSITAGNIEVRRGTVTTSPLISETQFDVRVGRDADIGDGLFTVLIGKDTAAPASPTYGLFAAADATGLNGEVKFLIINGLAAGNSVFGDGASVALQTTATTLTSQTTTFPAASTSLPNIVIATVQGDPVTAPLITPAGATRLLRGTTVLATNQYDHRTAVNKSPDAGYQVLVSVDTTAPASPTYSVDSLNSNGANQANAEAKILIFRGLSAVSTDTGSVAIGTTRTVIGSLATTFAAGDDVILGAIQLEPVGAIRTIAAGADDIRRTGDATGSSNQFPHTSESPTLDGGGQYQAFARKVTTTAGSPSYEGAATSPATGGLNAELKLIAIHVRDATPFVAETEFTLNVSSATPLQFNFTIVQQYSVGSLTVTIQVFNYTGASYPTTGEGYLTYTSSATPSTDETSSLTITTNPQHYTSAGAVKVKLKGSTSGSSFDQKANLVRLYYYQQTYDHVLKIVNQQATVYNIRLNAQGLTQSNIGHLTNFTAWFHDGSSSLQLQILSGSFSTQTGSLYSLGSLATAFIAVRVTASSSGISTIDFVLQTYHLGGNSHTDYRLTFKIT